MFSFHFNFTLLFFSNKGRIVYTLKDISYEKRTAVEKLK